MSVIKVTIDLYYDETNYKDIHEIKVAAIVIKGLTLKNPN